MKKFYNASEAAEYLGISRQYFYVLKRKLNIQAMKKEYNMPFYAVADLKKLKLWLARI